MATTEDAVKFLKEKAPADANGNIHLKKPDYMKFMEERGVTEQVLKAVNDAHENLEAGVYDYAGERLMDKIKEAKKSGDDPRKCAVKSTINMYKTTEETRMLAAKEYPVPNKDEKVVKTAIYTRNINMNRMADKKQYEDTEARVRKALGI